MEYSEVMSLSDSRRLPLSGYTTATGAHLVLAVNMGGQGLKLHFQCVNKTQLLLSMRSVETAFRILEQTLGLAVSVVHGLALQGSFAVLIALESW